MDRQPKHPHTGHIKNKIKPYIYIELNYNYYCTLGQNVQ